MNGNLVDTGAALLVLAAPERLSAAVREAVERGPNWLIALSYWEVVLKAMKGKLDVGDPRLWWADALQQLSAVALPLQPRHIAEIPSLPPLHQDPFDRALIAQATVEELTLVTTDRALPPYASERFRVLQ
ncbi:MAG: type II toxin-antitoxin system VapC family toxin [Bryobacteraceae bacterium]